MWVKVETNQQYIPPSCRLCHCSRSKNRIQKKKRSFCSTKPRSQWDQSSHWWHARDCVLSTLSLFRWTLLGRVKSSSDFKKKKRVHPQSSHKLQSRPDVPHAWLSDPKLLQREERCFWNQITLRKLPVNSPFHLSVWTYVMKQFRQNEYLYPFISDQSKKQPTISTGLKLTVTVGHTKQWASCDIWRGGNHHPGPSVRFLVHSSLHNTGILQTLIYNKSLSLWKYSPENSHIIYWQNVDFVINSLHCHLNVICLKHCVAHALRFCLVPLCTTRTVPSKCLYNSSFLVKVTCITRGQQSNMHMIYCLTSRYKACLFVFYASK